MHEGQSTLFVAETRFCGMKNALEGRKDPLWAENGANRPRFLTFFTVGAIVYVCANKVLPLLLL